MRTRLAAASGVLALVTACGTGGTGGVPQGSGSSPESDGSRPSPAPTAPTATQADPSPGRSPQPRPRRGTGIQVADSAFGPMLFAASGQPIYLFDRERGQRARCYGPCAADWPPVLTDGEPRAVRGARPGLLGTTQRRDGNVQVTYGGHPLYFYAHEDPWQVLCHDVVEYGGTWLVVQPGGDAAP